MKNMTCIVCPIGCALNADDNTASRESFSVTGNRCPRGADYAYEEIRAPKRTVTATCCLESDHSVKRIPAKTAVPCPREKIPALLQDIYKVKVTAPVKAGDILIADWKGEGIDVVATRSFHSAASGAGAFS